MNLKTRNKVAAEFNMSSMTDLVFLLLIFFMLLSTLVTNNTVMDLTLPKSSSPEKATKSIVVSLDKNMVYKVDNIAVTIQALPSMLQSKAGDQDATIAIAIDENTPHKYFVELAEIVSVQLGYKMVLITDKK